MDRCMDCTQSKMWIWLLMGCSFLGSELTSTSVEAKVCIGTSNRVEMAVNQERHHYEELRDRYTNCTFVEGNLEIVWIMNKTFDLSFLQHIREVTGYVLLSHIRVSKVVLPSLQIIRGRTLFGIGNDSFALIVSFSEMNTLELPVLRDIPSGKVGIFHNYNLCHIKTINWEEILTDENATQTYVYDSADTERECPPCHKSCTAGCWGEGPENCQKFSKMNCSPQCERRRCFGPEPRQCCHVLCAGGCTGPKQTDCLACRGVDDDGVCRQECPPIHRYNPVTYLWETNPTGKYTYGTICVKICPEHLFKDNGACVKACSPNKTPLKGECIPYNAPFPKICVGEDSEINSKNVHRFKYCTVIEGNLKITNSTFTGSPKNNTSPMSPEKLEVFNTLKKITGYLHIEGNHENFTSLSFLKNLEIIEGLEPGNLYSVYITHTSLRFLGLTSLKAVYKGVVIWNNEDLCYIKGMNWCKIKKLVESTTYLENNRNYEKCIRDDNVCDRECTEEGCWGPGPDQCIS